MRTILFWALLLATSFYACTPEAPESKGNLELVFKVKYNDNPLVLSEGVTTGQSDPISIKFEKLDFFIADIAGVNTSNSVLKLTDVGYISMQNSISSSASETGTSFMIKDIPIGNYQKLNLGVGLPDAINEKSPGDYPSSSPLGQNGNYWASWNSYVLCKIEGSIIRSNGDNLAFLHHGGVNGMYQPRVFNKNFTIADGQTTQLIIHINAEDIFYKTGSEVDLINNPTTHSGTPSSPSYALAKTTMENLANALVIQ